MYKIKSREITSLPETKNVMNMMCHLNHHQNKPCAHHKTHLHRINIYNTLTRSVYSLTIEVFTEVFTCSQVINAFKRYNSWTDPFHVLWHQSFLSFLYKIKHSSGTRCDSYSQFPQSLLETPWTTTPPPPLLAGKHKNKETLAFLESRC